MIEVQVSANNNVIAAVIERGGRFLVCQRPAHKRHGSLWEFPGGKLEPDESFLQAARRELSEELAMSVEDIGEIKLAVTDEASGFLINFVEVRATGEPQLIEHSSLRWLNAHELLSLPLAPSDRAFVEHLVKSS